MNPLIVKGALGAASALGLYEVYDHFFGKPKLQSFRRLDPFMKPVQVVVPVTNRTATIGQSTAPIPPNNGTRATFVPPPASNPARLGVEPTIIVGGQAANLSVDSVVDVQRALNVLGAQPPLATDNEFGPKTSAAISAWQRTQGMAVTGSITPQLKGALSTALAVKAATQSHVGQSLPVQQASLALAVSQSPLGASLSQSGLAPLAQVIQVRPDEDSLHDMSDAAPADIASGETPYCRPYMGADQVQPPPQTLTPAAKGDVGKDAILKLQRLLNVLGASPALEETGTMTPETIAATKAFQITYGLVADGVPAAKTVTAVTLAADPHAQAAVLPSLPKSAATVMAVTPAAPTPVAADHLATAASTLSQAAQNPAPSDAQTHASTASAMAATAATSPAASPATAEPLAKASNALATAAATGHTDPASTTAGIQNAAAHVADAASKCDGPACPSLSAAADHLSAAATAPTVQAQGDHLNAAAAHLSNAAAGIAAPTAVQKAAVNGEFGYGAWNNFWARHFARWQRRQAEVAQGGGASPQDLSAPMPPPAPMPDDPSNPTPPMWDGLVAQSYMPQPPMPYGGWHGRNFRGGAHPWFRGEFDGVGDFMADAAFNMNANAGLGPSAAPAAPASGLTPFGIYNALRQGMALKAKNAAPPPPQPKKMLVFPHLGTPQAPAPTPWQPPPVPANPPPVGHPDASAYWDHRREAGYTDIPAGYGYAGGGFDKHWYHRHGRGTVTPQQYLTNAGTLEGGGDMLNPYSGAQNAYNDPNAGNQQVQNPAADGQSYAGPGAVDDAARALADSGSYDSGAIDG